MQRALALPNYLVLIALLLISSLTIRYAYAATPDEAKTYVDGVGQKVIGVVNGSAPADQKQQQLQQMFAEYVDIPWIGQFVMGRSWQQASQAQRDRYLSAYKQYILARYTSNFTDYTGANYTITDAKAEAEGQYTVNMQIKAKQAQDTVAGYRLRADGSQFRIVDIIIEGVSLINTQRSEFASVIQRKGIDGLIADIEAKAKS